jgi:(p)ppGpp synthase/HD superfamily hydrolase
MTQYEKLKLSLRYYLLGKGWYVAVDALEYGESIHTGMRKDGVTPEFEHQIRIAHYLRSLDCMYPEETIAAALLHDVREDYHVADRELTRRFGPTITTSCILLDKNGKEHDAYFCGIADDAIASLAKGGDRIHNLQTMVGVFSREKQLKYVNEVRTQFFPMLKQARRAFPQQERAYENIKHMLESQIELIEVINHE